MKKYLITGLLFWVPLVITIWVLHLIVTTLDQSLLLMPAAWRPALFGYSWGLGAILTVGVVLVTGVVVSNFFGARLLQLWDKVLHRIPVVKSIYSSVKQVSDTLLGPNGKAFRKALLIQYPRQGSWTLAFLTGKPEGEIAQHIGNDFVSVYVPTTPNPTSGFFLMLPKADVIELNMSVDAALKHIISMGVVAPNETPQRHSN